MELLIPVGPAALVPIRVSERELLETGVGVPALLVEPACGLVERVAHADSQAKAGRAGTRRGRLGFCKQGRADSVPSSLLLDEQLLQLGTPNGCALLRNGREVHEYVSNRLAEPGDQVGRAAGVLKLEPLLVLVGRGER